jgi:hypothetical protein
VSSPHIPVSSTLFDTRLLQELKQATSTSHKWLRDDGVNAYSDTGSKKRRSRVGGYEREATN